jgi:hypothetical protein
VSIILEQSLTEVKHAAFSPESITSVPISDIENEIPLSLPAEETSLGRWGFPDISQWEMYHARQALLTVFSIT